MNFAVYKYQTFACVTPYVFKPYTSFYNQIMQWYDAMMVKNPVSVILHGKLNVDDFQFVENEKV
jgi:hypothetical protein